jgi:LPS export ABC transporter protein LptC
MTLQFISTRLSSENAALQAKAKRHTNRVKILRILGVFGLVSIMIAIFINFSMIQNFQPKTIESSPYAKLNMENQLSNTTLRTVNSKGKPITVKAKTAAQEGDDAILSGTESTVEGANGTGITISSDKAKYNNDNNTLHYKDNVTLKTSDGMIINTDKAVVNMNDGLAHSNSVVVGNGPQGSIRSQDGFHMTEKTLELKGKSKLTLR